MTESVAARRERLLEALYEQDSPVTTGTLATLTGLPYGTVYSDLRVLCGSHETSSASLAKTFPVIWHCWSSVGAASRSTTWELSLAHREWMRELSDPMAEARALAAIRNSMTYTLTMESA